MPELPDVTVYIEALETRIVGKTLQRIDIAGPYLLRTFEPMPADLHGKRVHAVKRVGKRIAIGVDGGLWSVVHLMIAGRLHWSDKYKRPDGRRTLAAWVFENGCLTLTEAGSQKRAALHITTTPDALDAGGIDVLAATTAEFARVLASENHTVKRALTDPRLFSGIGNAYSDEILHRARMSPVTLTSRLDADAIAKLHTAVKETLLEWTERLRREANGKFPEKVTAFRPEMTVHGKFGEPCPQCGEKVQRIRYADNETNYCAKCQTGGKLLADRGLSRLLGADWPRTLAELEDLHRK